MLLGESREVVVSLSRLVLHIAHEDLLVGETGRQFFCRLEISTTIVAYVDDERAARGKIEEHVIEIAIADAALERAVADISDVVVELAVADARSDAIVGTEIAVEERVGNIAGIVFMPRPVACHVERSIEIDMAVAQFAHHIGQHLEELALRHLCIYLPGIALVNLIPVDRLLREEAVVLVHNLPQCLEVALRVVGKLVFFYACSAEKDCRK